MVVEQRHLIDNRKRFTPSDRIEWPDSLSLCELYPTTDIWLFHMGYEQWAAYREILKALASEYRAWWSENIDDTGFKHFRHIRAVNKFFPAAHKMLIDRYGVDTPALPFKDPELVRKLIDGGSIKSTYCEWLKRSADRKKLTEAARDRKCDNRTAALWVQDNIEIAKSLGLDELDADSIPGPFAITLLFEALEDTAKFVKDVLPKYTKKEREQEETDESLRDDGTDAMALCERFSERVGGSH